MTATNEFIGSIESLLNDLERLSETQNPDVIDSMISRLQCASDTTNQLMHRSTSNPYSFVVFIPALVSFPRKLAESCLENKLLLFCVPYC